MSNTAVEFMAMASRASDAFVRDGIDLNESIAKIAGDRDLNPVQISRVTELANHETNERLRKTAEDKTFRFELASVDGVLGHLNPRTGQTKVAAAKVRSSMGSYVGREGQERQIEKLAASAQEHPTVARIRVKTAEQKMLKIAQWFRTHRRVLESRRAGIHDAIRTEMGKLATYAQNHLGNGGSFRDLHKLACNYDRENGRMWDSVFGRVRDSLIKSASASPMVAALKREELSPSGEVPVEVINNDHKLLIGLDTLRNKISEEDMCARRLRLLDTHGPAVVTYIKSLSSSADVQRHILEDISKVAEAADTESGFFDSLDKLAGIVGSALKGVGGGSKGKGVVRLGLGGTAALGAFSAYKGLRGSAEAVTEGTRSWRPGANRGQDEGGKAE